MEFSASHVRATVEAHFEARTRSKRQRKPQRESMDGMNRPVDDHSMMLRLQDNEVYTWIDQEVIMLKAVDGTDPVELTPSMARTLAAHLIEMADQISN